MLAIRSPSLIGIFIIKVMPSTEDRQNEQLHLGRQPILDRNRNIVAFELLFRSGQKDNFADHLCDSKATVTVINHAFNELGMNATLGSCLGFINVNEAILTDELIELLPTSKIIFEILETVEITEEVIARCSQLKSLGYRLAMDDVVCFDDVGTSILKHIDIIKLDIGQLNQANLIKLVARIKEHKPNIVLLAEKVETVEQFEYCRELGFDLFQGYFFAKPQILSGQRMSQSQLTIIKLLEQVMNDADLTSIENTLKENPSLSIGLLRIANSAATGTRQSISSIREAITILGRKQLQRWIQLLLYANNGRDKLSPLLLLAASRGLAMEMVAKGTPESVFEDHAFLTGILSLIDTLLGMPLDEAISQIQINQSIVDALLHRKGDLGRLLQLVEHVEQGNDDDILSDVAQFPHLDLHGLKAIHAESLLWANAVCQGRE